MPAFVETYFQTRARLKFVTTLEMDNFDCTKMNARFQKFTACLRERLIHEWKQALLAPPLPLMSLNNSRLCSTHSHRTAPLAWLYRTSGKLRILVKAQPYSTNTVLATVAFVLLLDASLLPQASITHYSQQLTLQHSTKLLSVCFFCLFYFKSI